MSRANDKIDEIVRYLGELGDIAPDTFNKYKNNLEKKAACERYFEKIVESVTDLAFSVITTKKFEIPEDDIGAFDILLKNKVIKEELASKLKNAKGMRNIISHQYGKVDDEIVFEAITKELDGDVKKFVKIVKNI